MKFSSGGRDRFLQYVREVTPHLQQAGVDLLYAGMRQRWLSVTAKALGGMRFWRAAIDVVTSREYATVHQHREAALERTDVIATSAWSLALQL